jgi:hypothetical protein
MDHTSVKIIECYTITGRGLLTEIQHTLDGLPPNTVLMDPSSKQAWVVKKRVLSGLLMMADSEIFFDCETEFEHLSFAFKTEAERDKAFRNELEKRKQNIYGYLLTPTMGHSNAKPEPGSTLLVHIES